MDALGDGGEVEEAAAALCASDGADALHLVGHELQVEEPDEQLDAVGREGVELLERVVGEGGVALGAQGRGQGAGCEGHVGVEGFHAVADGLALGLSALRGERGDAAAEVGTGEVEVAVPQLQDGVDAAVPGQEGPAADGGVGVRRELEASSAATDQWFRSSSAEMKG